MCNVKLMRKLKSITSSNLTKWPKSFILTYICAFIACFTLLRQHFQCSFFSCFICVNQIKCDTHNSLLSKRTISSHFSFLTFSFDFNLSISLLTITCYNKLNTLLVILHITCMLSVICDILLLQSDCELNNVSISICVRTT